MRIFPAEWAPQQFVQLTWPHADTDWAYVLDEVQVCFKNIAREIACRQQLVIVAPDVDDVRRQIADEVNMTNVTLVELPSNDTWARDHGGITIFETRDTRYETRDDKQFVIYLSEEDYNNVKSIEPDYLTDEWLWGNNPPYTFKNKQRFAWGGIEVRLDVKNGRIKSVEFNGDFFTHQDLKPLYDSFVDVDFQPEAIREVLNRVKVEEYILGATTEDILSLVETQ